MKTNLFALTLWRDREKGSICGKRQTATNLSFFYHFVMKKPSPEHKCTTVFMCACLCAHLFVGSVEQIMCGCVCARLCVGACCAAIDGGSLQIYQSQKTVA